LRILRDEVAAIACEDTRQTQKLLEHFEIRKPLLSYHEHNEESRAAEIVNRLGEGESIAIVTDAGTPLISDPGYRVVAAAIAAGHPVIPLPGPSAALAALAASGLPTDKFRFIGFLPPKSHARRKAFEEMLTESSTVVAYESPHRILDSLADMEQILGTRALVIGREITKLHEEFLRGTPAQIRQILASRDSVKGEITVVIGRSEQPALGGDPVEEVAKLQELGLNRMDAIKSVAKQMGLPKREVYRLFAAPDSTPPGKHRG
jgi:16S rRNA (cytidine1402-2'-O)-methyltransferase